MVDVLINREPAAGRDSEDDGANGDALAIAKVVASTEACKKDSLIPHEVLIEEFLVAMAERV